MNLQETLTKVTVGINPLPELMLQCSCSACDYYTCFAKRHDNPCSCNLSFKTNSFISAMKNSPSNFDSLDSMKLQEKITKECKDEMAVTYEIDTKHIKILKTESDINSRDQLDEMLKENGQLTKTNETTKDESQYKSLTNSGKKVNLSRAKLSAQIMNVPYKDFEDSISQYRPEQFHNLPKLSMYDLVQKIREVYKACSCKVCDCIVGKSQKNDICKCKPCDCNECNRFNKRAIFSKSDPELIQWSEIAQSRAKEECNCIPCECIQCADRNPETCACEPCQCIECMPHKHYKPQTLVVAAFKDDNQAHQTCQCSPCSCIECSQRFGVSSNAMRHEVSTGLNRHPQCRCETCLNEACIPDSNDTCMCERPDRIMRKPVQRDNEYDIRRTEIARRINQKYTRRDLITMYIAISNIYSHNYRSYKTECSCDHCECLDCSYKEELANSVKTSNNLLYNMPKTFSNINCDCSLCECEFCNKNDKTKNKLSTLEKPYSIPCDCEKCDCLNCDRVAKPYKNYANTKAINKFCSKSKCRCSSCECTDCDRIMATCTGDVCDCNNCKCNRCVAKGDMSDIIYPVKKGEKLTPAIYKYKMDQSFFKFCDEKFIDKKCEFSSINSSQVDYKTKFLANDSIEKYHLCDFKIHSSNNQQQCYQKLYTKPGVFKHIQCITASKLGANTMYRCNELENTNSKECISSESTESSISNFEYGNVTPQSELKNKSADGLCNTSEYDCPKDLDHFQKTPTETCLSDIIKLNIIDSGLNIEPLAIGTISIKKPLDISQNFYDNKYAKNLLYNNHDPSKDTSCKRKINIMSNDDSSFINNNSVKSDQASVSNQCCFVVGKNSLDTQRSHLVTFNAFSLDEDYKRAQKTLEDARKFSQHLLKLLDSYERANREFVSVSRKLKRSRKEVTALKYTISHNSGEEISETNSCIAINETKAIDDIHVKDEKVSSLFSKVQENMIAEVDINVENNEILRLSKPTRTRKNICSSIEDADDETLTKSEQVSLPKDVQFNQLSFARSYISLVDDSLDLKMDLNPICEENELLTDYHLVTEMQQTMRKKPLKKYANISKRSEMVPTTTKRIVPKVGKHIETDTSNDFNLVDIQVVENNKKNKEPFIFEQKMQATKKSNTVEENTAVRVINSDPVILTPIKITNSKLGTRLGKPNLSKDKVIITATSPVKPELLEAAKEIKLSPILKQNYSDRETTVKKFTMQPLELDIKDAVKFISLQQKNEYRNFGGHGNKALVKLHAELKKLLEFPELKMLETAVDDNREDYINSNKSLSCDAMKVNFLSVRKVSDHTIMVKWNAPKTLKNVQGYELLVDGHAVQKILNVSCCMAVVTCVLRNTEKMLLTVRTVTNSKCKSGHDPSTSVIYRPKPPKSSRANAK